VLDDTAPVVAVDIRNGSDIVDERVVAVIRGSLIVDEADVAVALFQARDDSHVNCREECAKEGDVGAVVTACSGVLHNRGRDVFGEGARSIPAKELRIESLEQRQERGLVGAADTGAVGGRVGRA